MPEEDLEAARARLLAQLSNPNNSDTDANTMLPTHISPSTSDSSAQPSAESNQNTRSYQPVPKRPKLDLRATAAESSFVLPDDISSAPGVTIPTYETSHVGPLSTPSKKADGKAPTEEPGPKAREGMPMTAAELAELERNFAKGWQDGDGDWVYFKRSFVEDPWAASGVSKGGGKG